MAIRQPLQISIARTVPGGGSAALEGLVRAIEVSSLLRTLHFIFTFDIASRLSGILGTRLQRVCKTHHLRYSITARREQETTA